MLNPPASNLLYPTSIIHCELFILHPHSKVQNMLLKMSSKYRDFQQNVRKRRLHRLQLFPGLPVNFRSFFIQTLLLWEKVATEEEKKVDHPSANRLERQLLMPKLKPYSFKNWDPNICFEVYQKILKIKYSKMFYVLWIFNTKLWW